VHNIQLLHSYSTDFQPLNMDLFDKIDRLMQTDLGKYAQVGHGYLTFPKLVGDIGPRMKFNDSEKLVWSLNNYLGLANDPEVRRVDAEAAAQYGFAAPMGARMLTGNSDNHEKLEQGLADFVQMEDAFLLNYGYQGCMSIIHALTDRRDVIVYDQLAHACIIDGMNLSLAKRFVYNHNDIHQLEDRLQKAQAITEKTGGGILVITEGVFGMKGDCGRLDLICTLKDKYKFRLMVDDAHGFGVMGANGRGVPEHYGVQDQVDILFNTFAKSMALIGAFVAGDKRIIQYLRYNLRSQIYAKSLPMPLVVGAIKRLELLRGQPERREKLWNIVRSLQSGLRERNFDIGPTNSPVTPVYMKGTDLETIMMVRDVRENHNLFVSTVIYPVVEKGVIILRLIPTAEHTQADVGYTLEVFGKVRYNLDNGIYAKEAEAIKLTV
jgi:glycine C-acetyltransferase